MGCSRASSRAVFFTHARNFRSLAEDDLNGAPTRGHLGNLAVVQQMQANLSVLSGGHLSEFRAFVAKRDSQSVTVSPMITSETPHRAVSRIF